jgi:hypothetical protein
VAVALSPRARNRIHALDADLLTAAALAARLRLRVDSFVGGAVIHERARCAARPRIWVRARIERAASRVAIDDARLRHCARRGGLSSRPPEGRRFPSPEAVALHAANSTRASNDAL